MNSMEFNYNECYTPASLLHMHLDPGVSLWGVKSYAHLVGFKVRDAGVGVYVDIIGGQYLGVYGGALAIRFIGVLDDVYLHWKLNNT